VFDGMAEAARGLLDARNWGKLARGLGLPPVPGLVAG
jgi:hypothetical protein